MPRRSTPPSLKPIEQYEHKDKQRVNNPPVGLVDSHTDNGGAKKKTYEYDPHLDPQLQWAGKAEHMSFEVPTVSLHVHERIDPRRIIESVRREEEEGVAVQPSLFETAKKPLREAIEFYKHKENWSNRLIAGDSLLVMNSLLEKEGMGGKVQMVFFDPPYGIKYKSNFQPFTNKKDVASTDKDDELTSEPEMIKAFRDTWELGIHSYLTYLRDRLLLAKELLSDSGSAFVQISNENVHHVREMMDEVFGVGNFCQLIPFRKKLMPLGAKLLEGMNDYLVWYAKDKAAAQLKFRHLYKRSAPKASSRWTNVELPDGTRRKLSADESEDMETLPKDWRVYRLVSQRAPSFSAENVFDFEFDGVSYKPPEGGCWVTTKDNMQILADSKRLEREGDNLSYVYFHDDFPYSKINNLWMDTSPVQNKSYVVQTTELVVRRCILMTTEPGDLVMDITCGSGTTAAVAEKWGRRWMTCDTSRIALTLAKQRLMVTDLDYYELAHPDEGIGSGLKYESASRMKMKFLLDDEGGKPVFFYDRPVKVTSKRRVAGPFTVEAVPAPFAIPPDGEPSALDDQPIADGSFVSTSIARSGETLRQSGWIDRLKDGIRGNKKIGGNLEFSRVEPLSGTHFLQAEAETIEDFPRRVLICFGPEHAPMEQRLVEQALAEANSLMPKPQIVLFCAFQFDPEARKDIEETNWPGIQLLEAQMDADLQSDDLKKKPRDKTNPGFWLIGQPDVEPKSLPDGMYQVEVKGFDYYNPKTGTVDSGGKADIAMWMLDPDYDGRSLFPTQVFFPMAGDKEGWAKLAKNLKADIDEEKIEAFRGTVSLPFKAGRKVAVKIIDARGIESLKIVHI